MIKLLWLILCLLVRERRAYARGVLFSCRRHAPQRMLLLYLATKMIKMILSLILVLIYCLAVREEARAFLLTFISFYLIYLIFETWFFFSFELNQKRKKKNKKKNETVA